MLDLESRRGAIGGARGGSGFAVNGSSGMEFDESYLVSSQARGRVWTH